MREVVYSLCALTSLFCAALLIRAYRSSHSRLLFWSSICFTGFFLNNVLLVVDELLTPAQVTFTISRDITGFLSVTALLVGLIKDTK
jgi:hypothetical protein